MGDKILDYSFDDLNLSDELLRGIYSYGFEKPSNIQHKSIPIINEVKDSKERSLLSGLLIDVDDIGIDSMSIAIECLIRLEENFLKNKRYI